jgi:hypothetical protein
MSGPATPWTPPPTDRQKQIVTATRTASRALQEPSVNRTEKCFFLGKPLSWMSRCHGPLAPDPGATRYESGLAPLTSDNNILQRGLAPPN